MNNYVINRLLNGIVAFSGVILASQGPIDWHSPTFWAGVSVAVIGAIRDSGDSLIPGVRKES